MADATGPSACFGCRRPAGEGSGAGSARPSDGFGGSGEFPRQARGLHADVPTAAAGVAGQGEGVEVDGGVRIVGAVGHLVAGAVDFEHVRQGQV